MQKTSEYRVKELRKALARERLYEWAAVCRDKLLADKLRVNGQHASKLSTELMEKK